MKAIFPPVRKKHIPVNRLALSASIAAALLSGYGSRQAFASQCSAETTSGTYTCSGAVNAATDVDQVLSSDTARLSVTITAGFGIDTKTTGDDARGLTSTSVSLTFEDNYASSITGARYGIRAHNRGTGALSITTTGPVSGTGGRGIWARNTGKDTTDLIIDAADVSGGNDGILAENRGTGITSISVSGVVTGCRGAGISNSGGAPTSITLKAGASVSAVSGQAIFDSNANTEVVVNTDASVIGRIWLGDGDDTITFAGGDFSGVTVFDGGSGDNDQLIFSGSDGTVSQSQVNNLEFITIDNGSTISFGNAFDASGGLALTLQNGGILDSSGGLALTGNLINISGVVDLQNGAVDLPFSISGDYTGGGALLLDVDFATRGADQLQIAGNVLGGGATKISIRDISGEAAATGNDITLVTVGGETQAGDFVLAGSPVSSGDFSYYTLALDENNNNWVLQAGAESNKDNTNTAADDSNRESGGSNTGPSDASSYAPPRPVALSRRSGGGGGALPHMLALAAPGFEALNQNLLTLEALPSFSSRLRTRLGNSDLSGDDGIVSSEPSGWLRISDGYQETVSNYSTMGADFEIGHWRAQSGVDFTVLDNTAGHFLAGVSTSYGQANSGVRANSVNSQIDTESYSIGLTGTWLMSTGVYVDVQAQKSWYEVDLSSAGLMNAVDVDGDGYAASVEFGRVISWSDSLLVTPQVQFVYSRSELDSFVGSDAEMVDTVEGKSMKLRMGVDKEFTSRHGSSTRGFL